MYEFSKVPRWLVNIFLFFDDLQSSYRAYEAPQGDRRVKTSCGNNFSTEYFGTENVTDNSRNRSIFGFEMPTEKNIFDSKIFSQI